MPSFQDLPLEMLLDNLLPELPLQDLLALSCTNRYFSAIGSEDLFWKRKLKQDYNFDGTSTARTSGWKFIYRGIRNPQLFLWGKPSNGRLGTRSFQTVAGGVPTPTRVRVPNARLVGLTAGGWSFHALDSNGNVYVWGQLNDGFVLPSDGFSEPAKKSDNPVRLQLPDNVFIRSLKSGRSFSAALDDNSNIWMFMSWGRPYRFSSPLLQQPGSPVIQVECGWNYCAALTADGEVLVWHPTEGQVGDATTAKFRELDAMNDSSNKAFEKDGVVNCFTWELSGLDPMRLSALPFTLPKLREGGKGGVECRLVKIAAGEHQLIGLTDGGHVVLAHFPNGSHISEGVRWVYLPNFSEAATINSLGLFEHSNMTCPEDIGITHISAHFRTFVAYSTGSNSHVLMATTELLSEETEPTIIPSLQNRNIISVHLGDYHFGALTADGQLLTWGQYSGGALGLGDPREIPTGEAGGYANEEWKERSYSLPTPPDVAVPSPVTFGKKGSKKFCFLAAAAGWHFGALVIDLEPEQDDTVETIVQGSEPERGGHPRRPLVQHTLDQVEMPMAVPGPLTPFGHFRVGFAGRNMRRGRGNWTSGGRGGGNPAPDS